MKRYAVALCTLAMALSAPGVAGADEPEVGEFTGETATAAITSATTQTCKDPALSTELAAFGDPRDYFAAPGGSFEDRGATGWRLTGNAQYNNPGSPYGVLGKGRESLRLQPGGTATSPAFCVDLNYPSFRFFLADFEARNAELEVEVIFPELKQDNVFMSARLKAGRNWTLTPDVLLEPERGGLMWGWRKVAVRFTAVGSNADFRVDDLVIDPRMRH